MNNKTKSLVWQVVFALALLGILLFFGYNLNTNIKNLGIKTGFNYLSESTGFDITIALIDYDASQATHFDAYLVGILNTLLFAVLTILFSSVLGLLVTFARLSDNREVSLMAYAATEYVRNIPVLVHVFIWYFIFLHLPSVIEAEPYGDTYITNSGIFIPSLGAGEYFYIFKFTILLLLLLALGFIMKSHLKRKKQKSLAPPVQLYYFFFGGLLVLLLLPFFFGDLIYSFSIPEKDVFSIEGGWRIPIEMVVMILGSTIYMSIQISEDLRGAIISVPPGQLEAAYALNTGKFKTFTSIIVPQAMIALIPPLTSKYVGILRLSAIGLSVGYPDLMSIAGGSTLNITGQALENITLVMATYGVLCLALSTVMNKIHRTMLRKIGK